MWNLLRRHHEADAAMPPPAPRRRTPEPTFSPTFVIEETADAFVFVADVPGVKADDIEVHLAGHRLTISGKRELEHESDTDAFFAYERDVSTFLRAFTLPGSPDLDRVEAALDDRVLTVTVGKKRAAETKAIEIA
jgi:HSP20 family protein